MLNADSYMKELIAALRATFGDRLIYVGLQGSYLRGEATETSDIDAMVVIDRMTVQDLANYRNIISVLPEPEKSCGFICGREELAHWNPLELCHLIHTTRDEYGKLAPLLPACDERDLRSFIQLSIGNLYHALCHSYVHGDPNENRCMLLQLCKGVFFILQNLHYLRTGIFCSAKQELLSQLEGCDHSVMELCICLSKAERYHFASVFETMLDWCQQTLRTL